MLAVSCGEDNIDRLLEHVENIVVLQPDSALKLLDSIKNTIKSEEQQVRCNLLTLYAKDLNNEDISNDETIIHVIEHLDKTNSLKYRAFAEYYMGRIHQAQGNMEKALQFYLSAQKNTEKSNDNDIKGLICFSIGRLNYNQTKYEEAIDFFRSALQYFSKSPDNHKRKITVLNITGNCFLIKEKIDSAIICYNESLQLAGTAQDSAGIIQNLGVAYSGIDELDNAKQQSFLALKLNSDSALQSLIYLNIAKVYEKQNRIDSAIYFAGLSTDFLTKQNGIHAFATNYKLLSRLERKNGNYYKALLYSNKYIEYYTKTKEENVIDMQKIETEHKLYVLQREQRCYKTERLLYWGILGILTIAILCLIYIWKKKQERNSLEWAEMKNTLTKTQSIVYEKEKIRELYHLILEKNRNEIEKWLLSNTMKEKKYEIIWEEIYDMGKLSFDKIRKLYPSLTDHEFKIVCLEYLGYTNTMIVNTVNLERNTVQQNKSNIRRKLGIEERGSIYLFLTKQLNSDN
jgi:tetratricopeptide (TPR) repeat protein/DNA-binding CsgD family transcriptional regulator